MDIGSFSRHLIPVCMESEMSDPSAQPNPPRPSVGVHMKCCNTYIRAWLNAAGDAFVGWCPRCAAAVKIKVVEEGGSTDRFFQAK